jgi:hypothetical protein
MNFDSVGNQFYWPVSSGLSIEAESHGILEEWNNGILGGGFGMMELWKNGTMGTGLGRNSLIHFIWFLLKFFYKG